MVKDLWVLQVLNEEGRGWIDITTPVPFEEAEGYAISLAEPYRVAGRQRYYRAYCVTDDEMENVSWQALPDFPDFDHWNNQGTVAVMKDGSIWAKLA